MPKIHTVSFKHAFEGYKVAIKTQPNFRFHLLAAVGAVILGKFLNLNSFEWIGLSLTIFLVIVCELINTSIESVVDLLTQQHNHYAKLAKDIAAAAVLTSAIGSLVVAAILIGSRL